MESISCRLHHGTTESKKKKIRRNVVVITWLLFAFGFCAKAGFVAGNVNPHFDAKFTCWHTKATRTLSVTTTTHMYGHFLTLCRVGFLLWDILSLSLKLSRNSRNTEDLSLCSCPSSFRFPYFLARVLQTLTTKHINRTCQYYMSHALIIHASTLATRVYSIQLITYNLSPTSNLLFVVSLSVLLKYDDPT
jgi:hypothetical protein